MRSAPIGVFDSGMGGLGVVRALRAAMPCERLIFFGDNANAPYGEKTPEEIRALSLRAAQTLTDRGVKALVVACNTATSAAEAALRQRLDIPVVGIEPDLASARAIAGDKRVIVFATQATLSLPRYLEAKGRLCPNAVSIPAPELVQMVERGAVAGEEPEAFFREKLAPWRGEIGAIVLGCTHFTFLRAPLRAVAPGIALLDGIARLTRNLRSMLAAADALAETGEGGVELHTSASDPAVMARMRALYEMRAQ
ncbi:MAG TPA: glutamate racemase [Candidatus Pullichristensenella avicola]|nr:glutamate racemase [Candidatus Pullichristensenella avicola]